MLGKTVRVWFVRFSVVSLVVGLMVAVGGSAAAAALAPEPRAGALGVSLLRV